MRRHEPSPLLGGRSNPRIWWRIAKLIGAVEDPYHILRRRGPNPADNPESSGVQAALLPSRENPLVASSASMTPTTIDRPPTGTIRVAPRSLMLVRPTRTNRVHANSLGPDAFVVCGPLS